MVVSFRKAVKEQVAEIIQVRGASRRGSVEWGGLGRVRAAMYSNYDAVGAYVGTVTAKRTACFQCVFIAFKNDSREEECVEGKGGNKGVKCRTYV